MVGSIVAALFTAIVDSIFGMFERKNAKESEFKALALEEQRKSLVIGKAQELEIQKAQADIPRPKTAAELRLALGFGLLMMSLTLSGCMAAKVEMTVQQYKPEIRTKKPDPDVFKGPDVLTDRESAMGQYIGQLRAAIGAYNKDAVESNKKNGYPSNPPLKDDPYELIAPAPAEVPAVKK